MLPPLFTSYALQQSQHVAKGWKFRSCLTNLSDDVTETCSLADRLWCQLSGLQLVRPHCCWVTLQCNSLISCPEAFLVGLEKCIERWISLAVEFSSVVGRLISSNRLTPLFLEVALG